MDVAGISERSRLCFCRLCKGTGNPVSRYIRTRHIETYGIYDRLDNLESDSDSVHESDGENLSNDDQELETADDHANHKSNLEHDSMPSPHQAHIESDIDEE